VTAALRLDAALVIEGDGAADVTYPARLTPVTWPQTEQSREATLGRLIAPPFRSSSAEVRRCARRGLTVLLDWLAAQPGSTWQSRWIASGADRAGRDWIALPARLLAGPDGLLTPRTRTDLVTGVRMLVVGQVIRPGYPWLLRYRPCVLLEEARQLLDPAGFARLRAHCQSTGRSNPVDYKSALNRIAWILLSKGGQIRDITVGDCAELDTALREQQCKSAVDKPLYYTLLRETGVLPPDSPPRLKALRMAGQLSPAQLVGKYQIQSPAIRQLLTAYLAERAPELDYVSLVKLAATLCGLFWQDLERHHPGIGSLHLAPEVAVAWKERLKLLHDKHGNPAGERASPRSKLLIVRAFYQDIARWAAEDSARWGTWVAPCPIRASECSLFKETKQRKAAMDQRTRTRLPVLPALVRTAETGRRITRERLETALAAAPGQTIHVHGAVLVRRPGQAGRVYATDLATGKRRDLTYEEERAFWAWAIVEVLRHTGIRVEEMTELTHHSFVAYTLPSTGDVVPMLQIAPSKTDTERLLLVSPELGEVLAEIIHRVRNGRQTLTLVAAYDPYERTWGAAMPYLFQRQRGPEHHVISRAVIRRYLNDLLASSGLTDASNNPLVFTPHDFRRLFATDALRTGLPPHIAAKILGHADLGTTMGYAAVYPEDVVSHHRAFIARRRALRPGEEYRDLTPEEWDQFLHHFELRKVALGVCTRDFGTLCAHEHSCVRCPQLRPDPEQEPRLQEIRDNLQARITEASREGWLGEIAGLEATLAAADQKLQTMKQIASRHRVTHLGMPDFRDSTGRASAPS
jgi:integrase